jgi:hypothetical protein
MATVMVPMTSVILVNWPGPYPLRKLQAWHFLIKFPSQVRLPLLVLCIITVWPHELVGTVSLNRPRPPSPISLTDHHSKSSNRIIWWSAAPQYQWWVLLNSRVGYPCLCKSDSDTKCSCSSQEECILNHRNRRLYILHVACLLWSTNVYWNRCLAWTLCLDWPQT